jgi:CheY-like chemotaxis protein
MAVRVLVVDDNIVNLRLTSDVLEAAGFEVASAGSAEEALASLAVTTPDLVLMDIGLPGMDGLTLARRLKAEQRFSSVRIVALTAFAMKADRTRALAAGCDGYISKPINTRTFAKEIGAYLEGAGMPAAPSPEHSE